MKIKLPEQFKRPVKGTLGSVFIEREKQGSVQILDIRGWGYLTGRGGGLGINQDDAERVQDDFEKWVVNALNNQMKEDSGVDRVNKQLKKGER